MVPVEAVIPGILRSKLVARGCAGSSDLLCSPATPAGVRLHQVGTPARWWGHLHLALSRLALQAPLLLSRPPGCLCSRKSTLFSNHEQLSHLGTFLALSRGSPDTLVLFSAFLSQLLPHSYQVSKCQRPAFLLGKLAVGEELGEKSGKMTDVVSYV